MSRIGCDHWNELGSRLQLLEVTQLGTGITSASTFKKA